MIDEKQNETDEARTNEIWKEIPDKLTNIGNEVGSLVLGDNR